MFSFLHRQSLKIQAVCIVGLLFGASEAQAQNANFSTIARNINQSVEEIPGLVTGLAYLLGIVLGVLGLLKIKDHVENPSQNPLKDGIIRLVVGGALFGLPIIYDAMLSTIGTTNRNFGPATLNRVDFNVR